MEAATASAGGLTGPAHQHQLDPIRPPPPDLLSGVKASPCQSITGITRFGVHRPRLEGRYCSSTDLRLDTWFVPPSGISEQLTGFSPGGMLSPQGDGLG